ncbi:MAG: glycosyltransferase [Prevotella sp.]|nr:glycosyltransferase [Prevotella sp.]
MRLAFFNNSLNHHQVHVADEFYHLLGKEYVYVATVAHDKIEFKGGTDYSSRPYLLMAGDSDKNKQKAIELAKTAEVCVFGAESIEFAIERAKQKDCGMAFELSERWLKKGWFNILSPRLLKWWWYYQTLFRFKPFYKLNASAFAAGDHARLLSYKGRCYKWGYFTHVDENFDVEVPILDASTSEITPIMWCSRFLKWKHPKLAIQMAAKLKTKGYKFILDYYGSGEQERNTKELVKTLGLEDVIKFHGELPNGQIITAMRHHYIFLFTSDRNEGWGAVANESMANGCVLVASDAIGSTPYLIQNGRNGFLFKSCCVDSLTEKVQWLLDHPQKMQEMRRNARQTMIKLWSPRNAAESFLKLIDDLKHGKESSIKEGPASIAEIH